ncbi:uncharacterized protein DNG_06012 [Cephalotrichum gorgonifer]|uniref:Ima1 N-terminal domain-containing protein n=1 Tax=Cephalotrichum gorgonifer TaxID=2041049 RepID=A0AAE8SW29_9PEZI|nr:uncharacterized protein DNG_06012 [Cephalotrichum gorgonifer]
MELRYDGVIRNFLCLHCDATNYLDENGDITDPPVATTAASPQRTQYAIQHSTSPEARSPTQSIFCDECLKNQHLYTASLAQYFPDDPDDPESPRLERKYYKFRATLEERYPQICAECEPRVLGKLDAAGYVAKTDYLRRVMERNRARKTSPRRRTLLGLADGVGRWLWWGSLALQLLWHMRASLELLSNNLPLGEQGGWLPVILGAGEQVTRFLPSTDRLIRLALQVTVLGIWWNPKLPQIVRGFSRPVLGLSRWYAFQALLVLSRYLFPRVVQLEVEQSEEMTAQFAIHAFMAGLVCYVYVLAGRCIRMDTAPLFAPADVSALRPKTSRPSQGIKKGGNASAQNLSDVLDDILNTPSAGRGNRVDDSPLSSPLPPLRLNTQTVPQRDSQPQYSDEMEWSPTTSPPPAFKDFGTTKTQPFGQPQSHGDQPQRPFWAKIPPAPKAPAHRQYNPVPRAEEAIKRDRQLFTARFGGAKINGASDNSEEGSRVDFAQPSFFPPIGGGDPRNSLADMLGSSFSLSQEDDEAESPSENPGTRRENPFARRRPAPAGSARTGVSPGQRSRTVDAAFLVAVLGLWIYAAQNPGTAGSQMMKASLAMGALHVVRVAVDTAKGGLPAGGLIGLALCLAELGAVGYLSARVWAGESCKGCFEEGLLTMAGLLGHQLWATLS